MDWLKNMETWQYEWRDDIQADSEIPDGYRYVGATSNDILNDLNIQTEYSPQGSELSYVYSDKANGCVMITFVSKGFYGFIQVSAEMSYDLGKVSSLNKSGLSFEGVRFSATMVQHKADNNNPVMSELTSLFEISYGTETFSKILTEPSYPYVKDSKTQVLSGSINVPAGKFQPHLAFGKAYIKSGVKSSGSDSRVTPIFINSQISWPIEKWPMFRPKK